MSDQMPGPTPGPAGETPVTQNQAERTWAMLAHLSGIIFGFLGPLVIWLIKKETMPFVNEEGKKALNWQITVLIGWVVAVIFSFMQESLGISFFLYPALLVLNLIFCIMGGVKANEGTPYTYPFSLKLVS